MRANDRGSTGRTSRPWWNLGWTLTGSLLIVLVSSIACASPQVRPVAAADVSAVDEPDTAQAVSGAEVSEFMAGLLSVRDEWRMLKVDVRSFVEGVDQRTPIFQEYVDQGLIRTAVATNDLSNGGLLERIANAQAVPATAQDLSARYVELRNGLLDLPRHDDATTLIAEAYAVAVGLEHSAISAWTEYVVFGDVERQLPLALLAQASVVVTYGDAKLSNLLAETHYTDQAATPSLSDDTGQTAVAY